MFISATFLSALCLSVACISLGIVLSRHLGVLDHPGAHKQHSASTPFVGGAGIFFVLICAVVFIQWYLPRSSQLPLHLMTLGLVALFLTGLADDVLHLKVRTRIAVQVAVALSVAALGGLELEMLGDLFSGTRVTLGALAVPFTVFAAVGVINAINMIDGIDGISGLLSFISLTFVAMVAGMADHAVCLVLSVALMGAIAGFLWFNLRYPSNYRAKVFLGDNGSLLIGFVLVCLFIALTQGHHQAMPPVIALWFLGVPLMDTVTVMFRRLWSRKSPFHAGRDHLHHLFGLAGFRVSDTVWIIALCQIGLAAVGFIGLVLHVPDWIMFWFFLAICFAYLTLIGPARRFVFILRRFGLWFGFASVNSFGLFVGCFDKAESPKMLDLLALELGELDYYRLSLYQMARHEEEGGSDMYAVVEIESDDDEWSIGLIRRLRAGIGRRLSAWPNLSVRLCLHRRADNDRRVNRSGKEESIESSESRLADRRGARHALKVYGVDVRKGETEKGLVRA